MNLPEVYKNGMPVTVFKYLPLAPQLARMYQNENLVSLLQAHSTRNKDGIMKDILDTDRWKKLWFGPNREFNDNTGCVLNFCTAGVNPYKTMHLVYSMWPMMMCALNFLISFQKSVWGILLLGILHRNYRRSNI